MDALVLRHNCFKLGLHGDTHTVSGKDVARSLWFLAKSYVNIRRGSLVR